MIYREPEIIAERGEYERVVLGIDWGTINPTAAVALGERDTGELDAFASYHYDGGNRSADEHAEQIANLGAAVGATAYYVDPAAADGKLALQRLGLPVTDAENAVLVGIAEVQRRMVLGQLRIVEGTCRQLEREMAGYIWDPKAAQRGIDRPISRDNHQCDALRYGVMGLRSLAYDWASEFGG